MDKKAIDKLKNKRASDRLGWRAESLNKNIQKSKYFI